MSSVTLEIKAALPEPLAAELVEMICCFAHPNPKKRGDVRATFRGTDALAHTGIISAQYDLEYIISRVDHLATLAKRLQCPAPKEPTKRKFLDLLFDR